MTAHDLVFMACPVAVAGFNFNSCGLDRVVMFGNPIEVNGSGIAIASVLHADPRICNPLGAHGQPRRFGVSELSPCLAANNPFGVLLGARGQECFDASVVGVSGAPRSHEASISVSPNPSRGNFVLNFSLARDTQVSLQLCDIAGRIVGRQSNGWMAQGPHRLEWQARAIGASHLQAGIYFLRILDGRGTIVAQTPIAILF